MKKVNLGGDRLGSGAKNDITLHGYERSNHDLSYLWKSTMSAGTLVPFMSLVALPGDTFDINLDSMVKTHPTIGPLFGSFKLQLDVFTAPIRLYHKLLHNNKLGIGMTMKSIKFPVLEMTANNLNADSDVPYEFQQINQSSLLAYLGIRGLGQNSDVDYITTTKNGLPFLMYWDIFKNYYANKQESAAYVIHGKYPSISRVDFNDVEKLPPNYAPTTTATKIDVYGTNITPDSAVLFQTFVSHSLRDIAFDPTFLEIVEEGKHIRITKIKDIYIGVNFTDYGIHPGKWQNDLVPTLESFILENLDLMRESILTYNNPLVPFKIDKNTFPPYGLALDTELALGHNMYSVMAQEGLAVKTYQSDLFNNWIKSDWIEGPGSISAITAISTAGGSFAIDTLNIAKKVYDMLNRVAVSGGSYEDYISAVYDHNSKWRAEAPVYHGGLSKEIIFQQVVSQAASGDEPLGTLAGQGIMGNKHKGGKVVINVDEPCYVLGIVSITPRVSYSQGNNWDTLLQTMDDLHKPALDGIGYQDFITDQAVFWDTKYEDGEIILRSKGKQPAWINYMTAFDRNYGNFADPRTQQFMTLDRRYNRVNYEEDPTLILADMTTYIDPAKFNYAFAQTDLSAQNFWVQIAIDLEARRKMSAKSIPYL